ncbi:MAG: Fe-S cluster assembly protein IscX [Cyanobacteria bacterium]|nr:Fe-S cluster assembly protein IscX [Cyanobacteriota bacterium]
MEQIIFSGSRHPQYQAFSDEVIEFIRGYGFKVVETTGATSVQLLQDFTQHSRLLVTLFYGDAEDAQAAFDAGFALAKGLPVIGLKYPQKSSVADLDPKTLHRFPNFLHEWIVVPEDFDDLVNPLISALNLHYGG